MSVPLKFFDLRFNENVVRYWLTGGFTDCLLQWSCFATSVDVMRSRLVVGGSMAVGLNCSNVQILRPCQKWLLRTFLIKASCRRIAYVNLGQFFLLFSSLPKVTLVKPQFEVKREEVVRAAD